MPRSESDRSAQERIRNARETQATELSLWRCGLTAVPDEIRELTFIESLNLSDNEIRGIPGWLSELPHLAKLDLSRNSLSEIPPELEHLPHLSGLRLAGNEIRALPDWLADFERLSELTVDATGSHI